MSNIFTKQKLKQAINTVTNFFSTDYYIIAIAVIAFIGHIFAIELFSFYLFTICAVFALICCDDIKPVLPVIFMLTNCISHKNGGGYQQGFEIFTTTAFIVQLSLMIVAVVGALIFHIIKHRHRAKLNYKSNTMLLGAILMSSALVLNGINVYQLSPSLTNMGFGINYTFDTMAIGALTALSLFLFYYLIYLFGNHSTTDTMYLAKCSTVTALLIAVQLIFRYILSAIDGTLITATGEVNIHAINLGAAVPNVAGALLVMSLPFVFYLVLKQKRTWLYFTMAVVISVCVVLTVSRNAILFMIPTWIVGLVMMLMRAPNKKQLYIALSACVGLLLIVVAIFHKQLWELLNRILENGLIGNGEGDFGDNGRFEKWMLGLEIFAKNPIFGGGFFVPVFVAQPTWMTVYDNLYHNIVVQMLASCGILGIIALYQHIKDIALLFKKLDFERTIIMMAVVLTILLSLLDVHFFVATIAMRYSICLAFGQLAYDKKFVNAKTENENTAQSNTTEEIVYS